MTSVLAGIRVLEVTQWAFVPVGGAVLADWGADVVKIEHPDRGDPIRGLDAAGIGTDVNGFSPLWESFSRGKRIVGLDIATPEGLEVLMKLVETADVFLTSYRPAARRALGIDVADIKARNPRIVYAKGSGQGPAGPDAEKGGFDAISFWARTGLAANSRDPQMTYPPKLPSPAFGDITSGTYLAGGVAAALLHRERTGEAPVVEVSLLNAGMWSGQVAITASGLTKQDGIAWPAAHEAAGSPLSNYYCTSDGRYITLNMLQGDRFWAGLCEVGERPDLGVDPRFADTAGRRKHRGECIAALDEMFAGHTLEEWISRLSRQEGQWDVVQTPLEVHDDRDALGNGYVQDVDYGDGRRIPLVSAPIHFDEQAPVLRPAGGLGEHTDAVLSELGIDDEQLIQLKIAGVTS